jgi:hypothetical protein
LALFSFILLLETSLGHLLYPADGTVVKPGLSQLATMYPGQQAFLHTLLTAALHAQQKRKPHISSLLMCCLCGPFTAADGTVITTGLSRLATKYPGLNGTGTLICLVDTGIQYKLPVFGSCSGINAPAGQCQVVVGRDMVGSSYDGSPGSLPVEGNEPVSTSV